MAMKRHIKYMLCGIGGLIVLFAVLAFMLLWQGGTKDIEAAANSFQAPNDWRDDGGRVEPPRIFCLSGRCPELTKYFVTSGHVTRQELDDFIQEATMIDHENSSCLRYSPDSVLEDCEYRGMKGGYDFDVYVEANTEHNETKISLFLSERGSHR